VDEIFRQLKNKAIQLLSRREHGEKELLNKLLSGSDIDDKQRDIAEKVLEELVQRDYVSDARFAEMSVRNRAMQGYGPLRICQELKQKQVPEAEIELAMKSVEIDWFENVVAMRDKKFGLDLVDDIKLRAKQQRFLQYKGYSFDHIQHAMAAKSEDHSE